MSDCSDYYQGLCAVTAKERNLVIDTSKISATVYRQKKSTANNTGYDGVVNLFGVFTDGAPVILNMEVNVIKNSSSKKTWLFFIASPLDKKDEIWKQLYSIRSRSLRLIQ